MECVLIFDDIDDVVVTDDVQIMCNKKMYKECFINVACSKINLHFNVTKFVHENGVMYIPKKIEHMFNNECVVKITIIDPETVKDISLIQITPISDKFYKGCSQQNLVRFMEGAKIMSNFTIVSDLFQIKGLFTKDNEKIEFGRTTRVPFRVEVLETNNSTPSRPWYLEQKDAKKEEPKKQEPKKQNDKLDYSPTKTDVYKRTYIKNGEIVYIK